MSTQLQIRRDTAANLTSANTTYAQGEPVEETDTGLMKYGDGTTAYTSLPYYPAQTVFTNQADPATPATGTTSVFSRAVCGKSMLKTLGPSGLSTPLQPSLGQNSIWLVSPNTTTTVSAIGGAVSSSGTLSTPTPGTTSFGVTTNFASAATVAAAAGTSQAVAPLNTSTSGPAANGGFWMVARMYFPDANYGTTSTGCRFFIGVTDQTLATMAATDNFAGSRLGFAMSTNLSETAWQFSSRSSSESRVNTTMTFTVNHLMDFYLFVPPAGGKCYWRVDDLSAGTSQEGSTTTQIPATTVYMRSMVGLGTLTTTARNLRLKKIYVETDS